MDFAFTTAPERVAASMCRPMAWEAMRQGHKVHGLTFRQTPQGFAVFAENPGEPLPEDPFLYGHTGLVLAAAQGAVPGWRVDWDPARYDRELWIELLGDSMWNAKARITTLGEAMASWTSGTMHLCPSGADSGPKAFKGFCCDREQAEFELARAAKSTDTRRPDPAMRVALSPPDAPKEEYRCVFVHRELVACGRYLLDGSLAETRGAPPEIEDFARSIGSRWLPDDYCVVDVGVRHGKIGVVELNGLHASGLYSISREPIVAAIAASWPSFPKPARARKP
jgi:hypothetical protein